MMFLVIFTTQNLTHIFLWSPGTDGSTLCNQGPCYSTAIIYVKVTSADFTLLEEPVSSVFASNHGEMTAIAISVTKTVKNLHQRR